MVEGQELPVCLLLVRLGESFLNWGLTCPETPFVCVQPPSSALPTESVHACVSRVLWLL